MLMKRALKGFYSSLPASVRKPTDAFRDKMRLAHYRGDRYECPICGAGLRAFAPAGLNVPAVREKKVVAAGYRQNVHCPSCWTNDRDRLVYRYVCAEKDLTPPGAVIFHAAPENILFKHFKKLKDVQYITADYMRPRHDVRLDIQHMPFPDESVDLIICNHVLEHVADDRMAMREFHRVLKPGGRAVLQAPIALAQAQTYEDPSITDGRGRELAFVQSDHVRLYGRDYGDRLESAGFDLDRVNWRARPDLFGADAEKHGYNPDEDIYVVRKA